ncbi:hypothetical protein [Pedobacter cryophilus]|uniref:Uncharacterized protein n=1 Tax=Pedobacter cryophilus TaxID=2571271 RepID=A0A4U1BZM7_9SPHI|nr:hypothetical protein [Pedobacter cryophilus]TKB98728.1 hypothetical protein FA046_06320 [Pedobacter cryophilus]
MFKKSVNIISILILLIVQLNFSESAVWFVDEEIEMSLVENNPESSAQDTNENESEISESDRFLIDQPVLLVRYGKSQALPFITDSRISSLKISLNNPPPEG